MTNEGHISGCSGGDTCLRLRNAPAAVAEADAACGLITSAPACPTLSHTTTLVGTTQLQKFDAASTTTWTFPDGEGMGESDMCSLREIVGEVGNRPAAKDIDRSLRISTDSKTPYSDATQVKYSINLDLRHNI